MLSDWPSIPAMLRWAGQKFPAAEAVVETSGEAAGLRITYAELADRVGAVARAFVAAGVQSGERVAVWAPNGIGWIEAVLGLQSAGAVLVPLSTRFKGPETAYILAKSRAVALVSAGTFLGTDFPSMLEGHDLPDLRQRIVLADVAPDGWTPWREFVAAGRETADSTVDERVAALGPADLSDLMFTSGTTGAPKGVMATHGQTLRVFTEWRDIVGLEADDRYLIVNPMSHTFGYKAGVVAALMTGATLIPLPVFDVDAVLDAITAERVSVLPGPPALYQSLLDHPRLEQADRSSLRLAVTGAAVIPTDLVRRMKVDLGFETVITAYGLTESCGCVTACRRGDDIETIALTSGRAFSGVEVRIVAEDGAPLPPGQAGEIVCRGYNVMPGYFEDPAATAEAIDADGWLHTGDIGTMDEAGNVRITDRKKDMFIVGGFNAYPAEIENLLLRHPALSQVAVVGVPDERLGEVGVAFAVPARDAGVSEGDIVSWAREQMANYKVPRRVVFVRSLPLNSAGKVLKYELRRQAAAQPADPRVGAKESS